jgi:hypothetical protein
MVYCFLDHGELEIDNNATEREIKVLVMERNIHYNRVANAFD